MSVIKQQWKNYSELKYRFGEELSQLTESHTKEMSSLKANLSQSGLDPIDPTYSLRVDKLLADQIEAQGTVKDAQKELETGAIKELLTDPFYDESYGKYIQGQASTHARSAYVSEKKQAEGTGGINPDEGDYFNQPDFNYSYGGGLEYLKESGAGYQGMEEFYTEKYGAYERPEDEVKAEKSASSMAQARGVSGGQRSKTSSKKRTGFASSIGGNMFLGTPSTSNSSSGWWS